MPILVPESFKNAYTKDQKQLVKDLSTLITIGMEQTLVEDCPNCNYDSINDLSTGFQSYFTGTVTVFSGTVYERNITARSFRNVCPICKGKGTITAPNEMTILAMVNWDTGQKGNENMQTVPGQAGQTKVRIKSDSKYYTYFWRAKYFLIDGVKVLPITPPKRRGMGTRDGIVEIYAGTLETDRQTAI